MSKNERVSPLRRAADGFVYWFAQLTAWPVMLLAFRTKVYYEQGAEHKKLADGSLIAATHSSIWDPLVLFFVFPWKHLRFLCSDTVMRRSRLFFRILTIMGCIPVSRESFEMGCVWDMVKVLEDGGEVCIFPEGHLSPDGEVQPYKAGVTLIALRTGAPVTPVYIKPAKTVWRRKIVVIGKPVDMRALAGEHAGVAEITRATELLRERTLALKELIPAGRRL